MRILTGGIYQETNTFSPIEVQYSDFNRVYGKNLLESLAGCRCMVKAGVEVISSVYARIIPSGCMSQQQFGVFVNEVLDSIKEAGSLDGIWLNLHGAMTLKDGGSGETLLLKSIRQLVGYSIPIAVSLDFHANIDEGFISQVNIVSGYRTVPHVDEEDTEIRTVQYLMDAIKKGQLPRTQMVRIPVILPGELVLTADEPTSTIMHKLRCLERKESIIDASFFLGFAWADTSISTSSITVSTNDNHDQGLDEIRHIAKELWDKRGQYKYSKEVAQPQDAIERAEQAQERILFLSDSGDNVTAGAAGDNAYFLDLILKSKLINTLLGGITDSKAVSYCSGFKVGDTVSFTLGGTIDTQNSKAVKLTGIIKTKKSIRRNNVADEIETVTVTVGEIDVLITAKRCSFTSPEDFYGAGINIYDYKTIVVKLGYLYDELVKVAGRDIIALTPGNSCQILENITYHKLPRPIYPLDVDMNWNV